MTLDTQVVEIIGRQRLIAELLSDGLEVAMPIRDRGVDLIAYADLNHQLTRFAARPIQMKASTASAFGVFHKYAKVADLIMAYVWHLGEPARAVTYAMTYANAVAIAESERWTETASYREKGGYSTRKPSQRLLKRLEPYRMQAGHWWRLIAGGETR